MNGKEPTTGQPPLPEAKNNPEERQPNPVEAEKAVNPELIPVEKRKPS